jgi:arylsulfatase A-like enzyme
MLVSSFTRFARLSLLCFLSCTVLSTAIAADASKPNVVFILADDLGWTDLAVQGSKYYQTPNIDKLAAAGMRFTSGYTCGPNCQPTRAALMSGQYGPRTGVYTVGDIGRFDWQSRPLKPVDNVQDLPLDRVTVAAALKKGGYATGMFGKWHLGSSDRYHPQNRGFDEAIVSAGAHFNFKTKPETQHDPDAYLADFLTDKATDFIRRHKSEPFFLYLPHFGVHSPHEAKQELIARFSPRDKSAGHFDPTYAAMIASVDESVGRVVATLDELGLSKNTLVIFASDNGGVGGYERYGIQGKSITDNAPLHGGKGMLYEGGIRVPYIFRWPGVIPAGVVCDEPINSVDLYPTLLELTGAEEPRQPLDGLSYLTLLKSGGQKKLNREALYWHFPGYLGSGAGTWRTFPAGAIRSGDWKLIEFFEDGHLELYNLRDDIGETKNLADSQPEKAKELHAKLVKWRQEIHAPMPTRNEATTPAAEESTKPKAGKGKGKGKKARKGKKAQAEQQETDDESEQLETKTSAIESDSPFHAVRCEGTYSGHLQGVCTNDCDAIYWSFTTELVKTDPDGHIQKKIDVATHHGDLCYLDGKLYVAVNLGQFNLPAGKADSWVFVYDAETLAELARHPVQEAVHGAGGIAWHDGKFLVVGGLPIGSKENYVFEYDSQFKFQQRRVLASGYTFLGIQTVCWAEGAYWFGCYGSPRILLKADPQLNLTGRWKLDASLGLVAIPGGKLLVASGAKTSDKRNTGTLSVAVPDEQLGLRVLETPAN